jgi:hypothetical protein
MASVCLALRPQMIGRNLLNCKVKTVWTIWIHRLHYIQRDSLVSDMSTGNFITQTACIGRDSRWQLRCSGRYKISFYFAVFFFLRFPPVSFFLFFASYYVHLFASLSSTGSNGGVTFQAVLGSNIGQETNKFSQ